jgi:hypothetical protein
VSSSSGPTANGLQPQGVMKVLSMTRVIRSSANRLSLTSLSTVLMAARSNIRKFGFASVSR